MSRLVAGFASSHSVMLTCTLHDWQNGFKVHDLKGRYFDREGNSCSYDELLARAPADAQELVTDEAIAKRYQAVREAIDRMKADVLAAKLDVLIICGDDQHELFNDDLMPPLAIYYGDTIRNPVRTSVPADAWYKQAQMRRMEEKQDAHYPCHPALALHLIRGLVEREFDVTSMKAMRKEQYEGHAFSFMHRFYLAEGMVPIVPIMLNTYYPPKPADAGALPCARDCHRRTDQELPRRPARWVHGLGWPQSLPSRRGPRRSRDFGHAPQGSRFPLQAQPEAAAGRQLGNPQLVGACGHGWGS
jgi:hypothetical protein